MQQEAVEEDGWSEVVDMLIDGQERSHIDVAALHYDIRYCQPKKCAQKILRRFADIHQIARNEQEARHVEGIHHMLGVRVQMLEIHQMETDDKQDEDPLQVVKFQYALHYIFFGSLSMAFRIVGVNAGM